MRRFATEHGFEIAKDFVDEGVSGAVLNRSALNELREYLRNGGAEVVIAYDPDRLSRRMVHLMVLADEFERQGIQLHFVTQSMGHTPEDKMLFGMKGLFAEYERTKLLERTMRGKLRKVSQDGGQPGGRSLYGYSLVDGRHTIHEEEAEVVRMVFSWLADDGLTLRSIQKKLNGMGVLTRKGTTYWQHSVLHRIAKEQAYTGAWHYNKTDRLPKANADSSLQKIKPRDQWVPVAIPPIISHETFDAAQRQLARNAELCNRNIRRQYLLSGLIRCGKCGYSYNARTMRDTIYYTCNSKLGHVNAVSCESHGVRGDIIEPVVWDCVKELLSQPKLIVEQMEKRDPEIGGSDYLQESLKSVGQNLAKKNVQIDKLLEAYTVGAIDSQLLKRQMDKVKAEQQKLIATKQDLEKQLQAAANQKINADSIEISCNKISSAFGSLTFTDKRFILREVLDKIVINGDGVTIHGIVPIYEDGSENVSVASQSS
ncbi:recombinase family protein [Chloroflexota bacterium]